MNCVDPVPSRSTKGPKVHHVALIVRVYLDRDEVADELYGFAKVALEFGRANTLDSLIFYRWKGESVENSKMSIWSTISCRNVDFFQLRAPSAVGSWTRYPPWIDPLVLNHFALVEDEMCFPEQIRAYFSRKTKAAYPDQDQTVAPD